jgi:steroid delta-isomerase-like uncharacterized protein
VGECGEVRDAHLGEANIGLDEVITGGNAAVLDEVMSPDLVWHGGSFGEIRGLEEFKRFIGQFLTAFPDLGAETADLITAGDKVVTRLTVRGTHTGELMGIPASGKEATWTDINIYRVADGQIAEEWFCGDYLGMMQQIGAIPSSARVD